MVFGSPCQSFSLAGKRRGMDDPRGNLALVALGVVQTIRPRWFVFENVPGLLSSANGRDFGALLWQVEECGYGWAYRTIDVRFYGLPQRRRRLFLVGYRFPVGDFGDWRPAAAVLFDASCLQPDPPRRRETQANVAGTIEKSIGECSAFSFQPRIGRCGRGQPSTIAPALAGSNAGATSDSRPCVVIFDRKTGNYIVRRLTPRECERLQGFFDDYTLVQFRRKPLTDTQRYQVLGNSMPVPVIRWIGRRIGRVDALIGRLQPE
jgi:DNA (cytosine-5)-methyltransferase 1